MMLRLNSDLHFSFENFPTNALFKCINQNKFRIKKIKFWHDFQTLMYLSCQKMCPDYFANIFNVTNLYFKQYLDKKC